MRAEQVLNRREGLIPECLPPMYIIGCGRSGTTILASIFAEHPEIEMLIEPYHLWALVDARADVTNLYCHTAVGFSLDREDVCSESRDRFERLILSAAARARKRRTMEKTPHNVGRIGFLEQLCPGSQYIHIVRDGLDVIRSIERLASENTYQLWHRPHQNQWWGNGDSKWRALVRYSRKTGYLDEIVPRLKSHVERGAYEWVVSLRCMDEWRDELGERLYELTYPRLSEHPQEELAAMCAFAELSCPADWTARSAERLRPRCYPRSECIVLPGALCDEFNAMQARYGFEGRALQRANGQRRAV